MNGLHYSIRPDKSYFLTLTVVDWVDVFSRLKEPESRRDWMLNRFEYAGRYNKKIKNFKFWQDGNHAIEVYSEHVTWQKINYIHQNPVVEKIVYKSRIENPA